MGESWTEKDGGGGVLAGCLAACLALDAGILYGAVSGSHVCRGLLVAACGGVAAFLIALARAERRGADDAPDDCTEGGAR